MFFFYISISRSLIRVEMVRKLENSGSKYVCLMLIFLPFNYLHPHTHNHVKYSLVGINLETLRVKQLLDVCSMICKQTITGCM